MTTAQLIRKVQERYAIGDLSMEQADFLRNELLVADDIREGVKRNMDRKHFDTCTTNEFGQPYIISR